MSIPKKQTQRVCLRRILWDFFGGICEPPSNVVRISCVDENRSGNVSSVCVNCTRCDCVRVSSNRGGDVRANCNCSHHLRYCSHHNRIRSYPHRPSRPTDHRLQVGDLVRRSLGFRGRCLVGLQNLQSRVRPFRASSFRGICRSCRIFWLGRGRTSCTRRNHHKFCCRI